MVWINAIIVMFISSCGPDSVTGLPPLIRSNPDYILNIETDEFREYYYNFMDNSPYRIRHKNLTIKFSSDIKKPAIAKCNVAGGGEDSVVRVRRSYWDTMDYYGKEEIINHELGHCVLFREHIEKEYEDGRPKSIMTPYLMSSYSFYYEHHRDEYIEELYSKEGKTFNLATLTEWVCGH